MRKQIRKSVSVQNTPAPAGIQVDKSLAHHETVACPVSVSMVNLTHLELSPRERLPEEAWERGNAKSIFPRLFKEPFPCGWAPREKLSTRTGFSTTFGLFHVSWKHHAK